MINAGSFLVAQKAICQYLSNRLQPAADPLPLSREMVSTALVEYVKANRSDPNLEAVLAQYPVLLDCLFIQDDQTEGRLIYGEQNSHQHKHGAYYTPPEIIGQILQHAISEHLPSSLCDPACGTGLFLTQGARLLAEKRSQEFNEPYIQSLHWLLCHAIYGAELDAGAVKLTRCVLASMADFHPDVVMALEAHIVHADALLWDWPRQFELVVGNPPYIDSESMIRHQPEIRSQIIQRYESARGNWDIYVPFVELAMRLTQPGGYFGLLTPTDLLHARYTASIQAMILRQSTPAVYLDYSKSKPFANADVKVGALICQKPPCQQTGEVTRIQYDSLFQISGQQSAPLSRLAMLPPAQFGAIWDISEESLRLSELPHRLGEFFTFSDGASTAQAYQIAEWLIDCQLPTDGLRLVNTGTIDPFRLLWGEREITYLKQKLRWPVIPAEPLRQHLPRRYEQAMSAKILMAGLSAQIEAVVAPAGVLCGKSAMQGVPIQPICLHAVAAYLNSTPVRQYVSQIYRAGGFFGKGLQMTSRIAECIPAPELSFLADSSELSCLGHQAHHSGIDQPLRSSIDECVRKMFSRGKESE